MIRRTLALGPVLVSSTRQPPGTRKWVDDAVTHETKPPHRRWRSWALRAPFSTWCVVIGWKR